MGWYFSSRDADLAYLKKDYDTNSDPTARRLAQEAGRKIANESGRVRALREALVLAHRKGDHDEIKNIHEDAKKRGY